MSDDEQTKPITMPPTHEITHRLDGWVGHAADPEHVPPAVEAMILIQRQIDEGDSIAAIRERMIARHRAAGLDDV
jgi:hypothetical protein